MSSELALRFQRNILWRYEHILNIRLEYCFDLLIAPMFIPSFIKTDQAVQEKLMIDFQDGQWGSHLGFPISLLLAIFDLLVAPNIHTMFHQIGQAASKAMSFEANCCQTSKNPTIPIIHLEYILGELIIHQHFMLNILPDNDLLYKVWSFRDNMFKFSKW